jgi:DNA-binding FadR family transcriptional regulator
VEVEPAAWPPGQLSRATLVDRVTDQLRQQILTGRLPAGAQMPTEKAIGEAFGVGRTTVREALHGLVSSGFLVRRSNQLLVRDRAEMPAPDAGLAALAAQMSVQDLFETRKLLESKAVALAARNWADDDIVSLRAALERMRVATDHTHDDVEFHAADVEFHTAVVRLAKNAVLERVYESSKHLFFKLPSFWRVFAQDLGRPATITGFEGHRQIVDAIEARDAAEAVRVSDSMLDRVASTLIERLERAGHTAPDGQRSPTTPSLSNTGGTH